MPLHYSSGIINEHLDQDKHIDVSHMGRFEVKGADAYDGTKVSY